MIINIEPWEAAENEHTQKERLTFAASVLDLIIYIRNEAVKNEKMKRQFIDCLVELTKKMNTVLKENNIKPDDIRNYYTHLNHEKLIGVHLYEAGMAISLLNEKTISDAEKQEIEECFFELADIIKVETYLNFKDSEFHKEPEDFEAELFKNL